MDNIFALDEGDRSIFLQHMMQSFGCTYICLWSYFPHSQGCLLYFDGIFREVISLQPSSSSAGSFSRRLFNSYCQSINFVDNGRIPGFAFKNNLSYMELKQHDFRRMASTQHQIQFYQEAGIQTVVFMGCVMGEIELGISTDSQVDLEMEMRKWFPLDISRYQVGYQLIPHQPSDQNEPSPSSSTSLRSLPLTLESPQYSPPLFNILKESLIEEAFLQETQIRPSLSTVPMASATSTEIRPVQFPAVDSAAAVLSSPATASIQNFPRTSNKQTAFRSYSPDIAPALEPGSRKENMFGRTVGFFRDLNSRRRLELLQENRSMSMQLHHMISERRRREKLNDSFQILRSLLPPGSKKDKASVLNSTTQYLSSLKSQVSELKKKNEMMESELFTCRRKEDEGTSSTTSSQDHQKVTVEMKNNEGKFLELRVREECSSLDLVICILEFLKRRRNVKLLSMESSTQVHHVVLRLRVEGDEFDEVGFQEEVRRVVDDSAH